MLINFRDEHHWAYTRRPRREVLRDHQTSTKRFTNLLCGKWNYRFTTVATVIGLAIGSSLELGVQASLVLVSIMCCIWYGRP